MQLYQENIKGINLELTINSQICDKGRCEEYTSKFRENSSHWAATLSVFVSLLVVLILTSESCSIFCSILVFVFVIFAVLRPLMSVTSECVLYVPNVGLQQTTRYACGIKRPYFIPSHTISGIIINEHIGWNHCFYLAVVIKQPDGVTRLYPLFQSTTPRLAFLQEVHNNMLKLQQKMTGS